MSCGCGACGKAGRTDAVALDVNYGGAEYDLLSPLGFCNAVFHTLNLKVGAACHSAPVCSTFVFMTLGSEHVFHVSFTRFPPLLL